MENLRYAPGNNIPDVPYWPGVNSRDPEFKISTALAADNWRQDIGYLHGIDLFNNACYWEAHEAWEHRWLDLEKNNLLRTYLQGLIQGSASLLKIRLSQPTPARTIWQRGKERLQRVITEDQRNIYRGVDIPSLITTIDTMIEDQHADFKAPRIVLIGWP